MKEWRDGGMLKRVSVEVLRRESNYSDKKMYFCADFF